MTTQTAREDDIRRAYLDLLDREPARDALNMWTRGPLSLEAIRERIQGTEEFAALDAASKVRAVTGCGRKLLVFGAYGNGNLGDMIQADSLRSAIGRALPDVGVWATSVMARAYPFPRDRVLPACFVRTRAAMSTFDALLVGGGGLLAHPHDPLGNAEWVRSLTLPVVILGVGASDFFVPQAEALIRKAAFLSARDRESMVSLLKLRPDVAFGIDPVLGDRGLVARAAGAGRRICWIVRGPLSPVHDAIAARMSDEDVVVGLEPDMDRILLERFPDMVLLTDVGALFAILANCARVISMRYHGVILGLKAGVPSYALDVAKGGALLRMLGLPHCAGSDPCALAAAPGIDMDRTAATIDWLGELHELALGSALRSAWG